MIDWIAFDADDTLWENEVHYRRGRELFDQLMDSYPPHDKLEQTVHEIEISNLGYYGYGAPGFILSLVEAAIKLTDGQFSTQDIQTLIDYLKEMVSSKVQLLEGARDVLELLSSTYPLALITKGDLRHQQVKIERSGLAQHFTAIEVVSDKQPETYLQILAKMGISPTTFVMVGNSVPSDVLPVLEIGAWAIYVPNELTWSHEQRDSSSIEHERFLKVAQLRDVPDAIKRINDGEVRPA